MYFLKLLFRNLIFSNSNWWIEVGYLPAELCGLLNLQIRRFSHTIWQNEKISALIWFFELRWKCENFTEDRRLIVFILDTEIWQRLSVCKLQAAGWFLCDRGIWNFFTGFFFRCILRGRWLWRLQNVKDVFL